MIDREGQAWISLPEAARRLKTTTTVLKKNIVDKKIEFTNFRNGRTLFIMWKDFEDLARSK